MLAVPDLISASPKKILRNSKLGVTCAKQVYSMSMYASSGERVEYGRCDSITNHDAETDTRHLS